MGPLGWPETVFIVILALLLFGPKKLPELGRTLGKAITEFRRASADLKSTFDREMRNLERETEGIKEATTAHFQDSYNYDYSSYDTGTPYSADEQTPALVEGAVAQVPDVQGHAAQAHDSLPHDNGVHTSLEGASAAQGALLTAAQPAPIESAPALTVTPAHGNIAAGSLSDLEHRPSA